jgi:hypothetical protein
MVSERERERESEGQITLVALITHHTPNVTSYNGTSWINMGNLLFFLCTC